MKNLTLKKVLNVKRVWIAALPHCLKINLLISVCTKKTKYARIALAQNLLWMGRSL